MKKYITAAAVLTAAVFTMATPSWAVFTSVQKQVFVASATAGGTPTVRFNASIKNNTAPFGSPVSKIDFIGAQAGQGWKVANQFILMGATVTNATGGIQIYTDNRNTTLGLTNDDPRFEDPTPETTNNLDSNPAGLLLVTNTSTSSSRALSMAWTIKTASATVGTTGTPGVTLDAADPNTGIDANVPNGRRQWIFMQDAATPAIDADGNATTGPGGNELPAFPNGQEGVTMVNAVGIHGAQGPAGFFAHPDNLPSFVYLQADFTTANVGETYRTSKLTLEAYFN